MKKFRIPVDFLETEIGVIISDDWDKVSQHVRRVYENENYPVGDNQAYGKCFRALGYIPIIWMPSIPKTPHQIGTLAHEVFHAVEDIAKHYSIWLSAESEEFYGKLIGYLVKTILAKTKI